MRWKPPALGLGVLMALVGLRCGGGNPAAPAQGPVAARPALEPDDGAAASATRTTRQRWIVEDACDDRKGMRVRLHDFTDRAVQFPRGYWRLPSGGTLNRVIECRTGHQICLGAVQDPPPGLVWGVGMRGERYPCQRPGKCCFRCDVFAHSLKLSCEARTTDGLTELQGEIAEEDGLALE